MNGIFLDILLVLFAAKIAAEVAERLRIPTVAAEIVAGIVLGPSVLGLVSLGHSAGGEHSPGVLAVLGEIGVILLLLEVGMHMDLRELGAVGRSAMQVAVIGVVVPMAAGYFACEALGLSSNQSLFVASALSATSVGITARVFGDLRALSSLESRTVLGAAVADDVLGLVILTVVVKMVTGGGSFSIVSVAGTVGLALVFLVGTTTLGTLGAPKVFAAIDRSARSTGTLFALALAFTLALAELASLAGLAPIIGAFVAGLSLGRCESSSRIQRELTPVGHIFIPVFFLTIGLDTDVKAFANRSVLWLAFVLIVVAVLGKLAAGVGAWGTTANKVMVGVGMIPRGEVGLIFAGIGLREAILTQNSYAAILLMVLVTTLMTPPILSWQVRRAEMRNPKNTAADVQPADGWLVARENRMLDLAANPPEDAVLSISLDVATQLDTLNPTSRLVTWLGENGTYANAAQGWDERTTSLFLRQIARGTPRSWRLLDTTGVLDSALPELAAPMRHRRAQLAVLDGVGAIDRPILDRYLALSAGSLHTTPVDRAAGEAARQLEHPAATFLAAFLIDALVQEPEPSKAALSLLDRLRLSDSNRTLTASLVADSSLLRAAAIRSGGLEEDNVLRLAAHLRTRERINSLFALTIAQNGLEPWEGALVRELHKLLIDCLQVPGVGDESTATVVDRNRDLAMKNVGGRRHVADRIAAAPLSYLATESPEAIVRHAELIEPAPMRGKFRVNVHPESNDVWRVEITSRDQLGLLALSTGVLEEAGLDVKDAVLATWGDGAALQAFRVTTDRIGVAPDALLLEQALPKAATVLLGALPAPDARITFDDVCSPWHTVSEVRATDRRGLLHSLAVAFAVAGVDVHSARITTNDSMALDHFDLTDRSGRKLTAASKQAIRDVLANGADGDNRRPFRFGRLGVSKFSNK